MDSTSRTHKGVFVGSGLGDSPTRSTRYSPSATSTCGWCGKQLSEEEIESPQLDSGGENICDDCYREHFCFTCCNCGNYEENDYQDCLVVTEEVGAIGESRCVKPGIYRVIEWPYYYCPTIGEGDLRSRDLRYLRDIPSSGIVTEGYPCGHICRDCQSNLGVSDNVQCELDSCDCKTCRGSDKARVLSLFTEQDTSASILEIAASIHRGVAYAHSIVKECWSLVLERSGNRVGPSRVRARKSVVEETQQQIEAKQRKAVGR